MRTKNTHSYSGLILVCFPLFEKCCIRGSYGAILSSLMAITVRRDGESEQFKFGEAFAFSATCSTPYILMLVWISWLSWESESAASHVDARTPPSLPFLQSKQTAIKLRLEVRPKINEISVVASTAICQQHGRYCPFTCLGLSPRTEDTKRPNAQVVRSYVVCANFRSPSPVLGSNQWSSESRCEGRVRKQRLHVYRS